MTTVLASVRQLLPQGSGLNDAEFAKRHRLIWCVLLLTAPLLLVVGFVHRGDPLAVTAGVAFAVGLPAAVAALLHGRRVRSLATSLGLMAACGMLVHVTGGLTEAHFAFFVLLPLVALYRDWVPFLASVGFVLLHHATMGTWHPMDVYSTGAAQHRPVLWAIVHAAFVVCLILVLFVYWHVGEQEQRALRRALDELKATQDSLVQARKLESLGQLAAGVAHEINTPIQYIGDNIRFLQGGFSDLIGVVDELIAANVAGSSTLSADDLAYLRDEVPLAIDQSIEGVGRVAEIVQALKSVAHPTVGSYVETDLNHLIADASLVTRSEWKYVATLDLDLDPLLPAVECAAGPISQVFVNMLVNSAHAIGARFDGSDAVDGRIVVSTRAQDDHVEVRIADNGCGVPAEIVDRIFDPFFTTKEVGKGTGQGLSLCRAVIVDQHAGRIEVAPGPDGGTIFTLTIPRRRVAAVAVGVP